MQELDKNRYIDLENLDLRHLPYDLLTHLESECAGAIERKQEAEKVRAWRLDAKNLFGDRFFRHDELDQAKKLMCDLLDKYIDCPQSLGRIELLPIKIVPEILEDRIKEQQEYD
ncbi:MULTISPECIES: hypothetical protein [unclassified Acinetobacter]|uniref:hypothetical protein n=1 Tax=unclassified Acinetobacter TaxID=196816 RepID=UPI001250BD5C|nr:MULTISPECIES: hypothetical protein [unclassified Acinetobacter]